MRCEPALAERVLAELLELAPSGVEEDAGEEYVEFAVYGVSGELPTLPDLEAAAGEGLVDVSSTEVPDDWADRWRDFHEPTLVDDRVLVRPSWTEPREGVEVDVVVDPGQAFGTGAHPTTRMCIELLVELADAGAAAGPLADLGTGSGLLAIVAAKLGFAPVTACDRERAAIDAAAANARANGAALELSRLDVREDPLPAAKTVVANLTAPLLLAVAGRLRPTPGRLVCSGMLATEADRVAAAFARCGLAEWRRRESGGWAAISFVAP